MHTSRWLVVVVALLCSSCATARRSFTRTVTPDVERPKVLAVPYVSQTELLCGGAAIAMIERWWGRRGVQAEDFSHLVRPAEGGIRTTDMASVMRERGWDTRSGAATLVALQQSVRDSVPVMVLIKVARDRYHYVVVVGWHASQLTYHDPAAAPDVTIDSATFLAQWDGANRWAMFVRPSSSPGDVTATPSTPTVAVFDSLPCRPHLDRAADAAARSLLAEADSLLGVAAAACPGEALVLRELAGVRFRQGRQAEASQLAAAYTLRAPSDSLGWSVLASSRYLTGDGTGALRAWNVVGTPTIDLLRIDGSRQVRFRVLADALDLVPRQVLTPTRLALARRRLADTPALAQARVSYTAVPGRAVELRAAVVERPRTTPIAEILVVESGRAIARREVTFAVSSPLGIGELWSAQWRWRRADPRLALRVDVPTSLWVPAIVSFERSQESFRFSGGVPDSRRSSSFVSVGGWSRPDLEHLVGARFERWSGAGDFLALSAGSALHTADDRLSMVAEVEHAVPVTGREAYDRVSTRAVWTLPVDQWANTWSVRAGADWAGASTPRGLWPIAGGGLSLAIPLRAHPFIVDDLRPADRAARTIMHAGVAADRHLATLGRVALGGGIFLDGASLSSTAIGSTAAQLYLDAGAGVHVALPGVEWAKVRIDFARGLATDPRWGVSAALTDLRFPRLGRFR